jgi:hypothetical protein
VHAWQAQLHYVHVIADDCRLTAVESTKGCDLSPTGNSKATIIHIFFWKYVRLMLQQLLQQRQVKSGFSQQTLSSYIHFFVPSTNFMPCS